MDRCLQVHAHLIQWYALAIEGKPVYEEFPELWEVPKDVFQIGGGRGEMAVAARYGPSLGRYLVSALRFPNVDICQHSHCCSSLCSVRMQRACCLGQVPPAK